MLNFLINQLLKLVVSVYMNIQLMELKLPLLNL